MPHILLLGIVLAFGFAGGLAAARCRLPKVTGYLVAGVLLSPEITRVVPEDFVASTTLATDLALAFITFEVGGALRWRRIHRLGRSILWVTVLTAELTFAALVAGAVAIGWLCGGLPGGIPAAQVLPFALVLGALGVPTDPSATLAVAHEYHARGPVTDTVLGVAALDDVIAIFHFALSVPIAVILLTHDESLAAGSVLAPAAEIGTAIGLGLVGGLLLTLATKVLPPDGQGALIVVVLAALCLVFGVLQALHSDPLLGTMTMGCTIVNASGRREQVFALLERYTEELIFVLFFTLSGMRLSLEALLGSAGLVAAFVALRAGGKVFGTQLGAWLGRGPPTVGRYAGLGLLPQGGIVIGLALTAAGEPGFAPLAPTLLGIVIGATVIHEFVGPVLARMALGRAGELHRSG